MIVIAGLAAVGFLSLVLAVFRWLDDHLDTEVGTLEQTGNCRLVYPEDS